MGIGIKSKQKFYEKMVDIWEKQCMQQRSHHNEMLSVTYDMFGSFYQMYKEKGERTNRDE